MRPLPVRTRAAISAARLAGEASVRAGRGAGLAIAGKVLLRVAPDALRQLADGRRVVLVAGTNGKTSTTHMITRALEALGPVASNSEGGNMAAGIAEALSRDDSPTAVIEVDEVYLPTVMEQTAPEAVVLLNLSRDQMDRVSEVASHVARWHAALSRQHVPVVVANADDPLVVGSVPAGQERVVWVSPGMPWRDDAVLCPRCGSSIHYEGRDWSCTKCDLARPTPTAILDGRTATIDGEKVDLELQLPGPANLMNATTALATAAALGADLSDARERLAKISSVQGRYDVVQLGGHDVRLTLVKNPSGARVTLALLAERSAPAVVAINAQIADGRDTSWLWDVPFEELRGRQVVAAGERASDLSVRLHYADVEHTTVPDVIAAIRSLPDGPCDLVANYTAFAQARVALDKATR